MPTSATNYFDTVFAFDGSSTYTNITLEMQSPAGTSATILADTNDVLYLGDASRFDMAIFDVDTAGSLGALIWEYYNGSTWATFTPLWKSTTKQVARTFPNRSPRPVSRKRTGKSRACGKPSLRPHAHEHKNSPMT